MGEYPTLLKKLVTVDDRYLGYTVISSRTRIQDEKYFAVSGEHLIGSERPVADEALMCLPDILGAKLLERLYFFEIRLYISLKPFMEDKTLIGMRSLRRCLQQTAIVCCLSEHFIESG